MKTITFMSFKGGAGKTTSLYLLVAALHERGKRIAVINADHNDVLHQWREYGLALNTWDDEHVKLWKILDDEEMAEAAEEAEEFGADYMLIDTAGGGSDLNDAILYNSDMVIIPSDLGRQELDQTIETMQYVQDYLKDQNASHVLSGFLLNRVPLDNKQFSADESEGWEIMETLPIFDTRIPDNKRIKGQKSKGLMDLYRNDLDSDKSSRFRAPHYTRLLKIGHQLADEIDAALSSSEEARDAV